MCKLDLLILYSFVLVPPSGWWFTPEACRGFHVYGWFVILCKLGLLFGDDGLLLLLSTGVHGSLSYVRLMYFTHSHTHSHTHTHTHTLTHSYTHTPTLSHLHYHTHTLSHTLTPSHTHTPTLAHSHYHTHTLSHSHTPTHTHSHT